MLGKLVDVVCPRPIDGLSTYQAARGIRNVETQLSDQDFAAMVQLEGLPKGTSRRGYVQKSVEDVLVAGPSLHPFFFFFFKASCFCNLSLPPQSS